MRNDTCPNYKAHSLNDVSGLAARLFVQTNTDIFAGEPPPLPVALALAEVVAEQKGGLTRRWFDRVLDARMADLERTQPETLEEMETWVNDAGPRFQPFAGDWRGDRSYPYI